MFRSYRSVMYASLLPNIPTLKSTCFSEQHSPNWRCVSCVSSQVSRMSLCSLLVDVSDDSGFKSRTSTIPAKNPSTEKAAPWSLKLVNLWEIKAVSLVLVICTEPTLVWWCHSKQISLADSLRQSESVSRCLRRHPALWTWSGCRLSKWTVLQWNSRSWAYHVLPCLSCLLSLGASASKRDRPPPARHDCGLSVGSEAWISEASRADYWLGATSLAQNHMWVICWELHTGLCACWLWWCFLGCHCESCEAWQEQ